MQTLAQVIQSGGATTHTVSSCSDNNITGKAISAIEVINRMLNADLTQPISICESCCTPTQKDMKILEVLRRVPILCKCRSDIQIQKENQEKAKELRKRLERFKVYSLMDNRFEISTFENWIHRPDNHNDYLLGTNYCDKWESMYSANRGLLLHGKAGNGKTFLSFAIANALYKQGKAVMAISVSKLLSIIKDSFDNHGDFGEADVLNTVKDANLLVLDDLGVEYKTSWAYEKLYSIIDTRYRAGKPIIITTNFSLDNLRENLSIVDIKTRTKDTAERIFSRITEMCAFCEVKGASWRISKGAENKTQMLKELGFTTS